MFLLRKFANLTNGADLVNGIAAAYLMWYYIHGSGVDSDIVYIT